MLISRRDGRLNLVTHPDHALLAEGLAEAWGAADFAIGEPRDALIVAAARHDDGWHELDGAPYYNVEQQRPAHFLEVPLPDSVGSYGRGVDQLYADDPYAGLLASMHWAGLYSSRWGVQDTPPVGHPAAKEVVEEQERQWASKARQLWTEAGGLRSEFEQRLWYGYEVLQALDQFSLALCLISLDEPTDLEAEYLPVAATLFPVDQSPGRRIVTNVPRSDGGHADVLLTVIGDGTVTADPFPFAGQRVELEIPTRQMSDEPYADTEAAAAAYKAAPVAQRPLVMVPAGRTG